MLRHAAAIVVSAGLAASVVSTLKEGIPSRALAYAQSAARDPVRKGTYVIDCETPAQPISPLIYGVAGDDDSLWSLGTTARRWGGNPTSRYNWRLNAYNAGNDWFFKNAGDPKGTYDAFLLQNWQHGVKTAMTVPLLDWVAKDTLSYSYPVSVFGPQQKTEPGVPDAGNGVTSGGSPIAPGPASRTSVPSTSESVEQWVRQITQGEQARGRTVDSYILDNEPMLWNATHRDVHPQPTTYDELLEKTLAYASAVRRADPGALIAGPAEWGWLAYHYSAKDVAAGVTLRPDRRQHGDEALIPWYLRRIHEYEHRTHARIIDILDVHFYSMAPGVGTGTEGRTDPATAALRIRSTRSLWDPNYVDESWINTRMRVLPLLREWIAQYHPGLAISIGEWSFGAESHMSGGLATAEALGRFGTEGVRSAYYWTSPKDKSPAYWAFRAYRDFDGKGGRFLDWSVPVKNDAPLTSVFVSRDSDKRHLVAILLNFSAFASVSTHIRLDRCGSPGEVSALAYTGGEGGFRTLDVASGDSELQTLIAPYSINVFKVSLGSH
jgi:hypothetical protein